MEDGLKLLKCVFWDQKQGLISISNRNEDSRKELQINTVTEFPTTEINLGKNYWSIATESDLVISYTYTIEINIFIQYF